MTPREDGLNNRDAYLDSLLRAAREISEKLGFNLAARGSRVNPAATGRRNRFRARIARHSPLATRRAWRIAGAVRQRSRLAL